MTLTYDKWEILLGENGEGSRGPFIGYYSPSGELIRYSGLVGGLSHDDPVIRYHNNSYVGLVIL